MYKYFIKLMMWATTLIYKQSNWSMGRYCDVKIIHNISNKLHWKQTQSDDDKAVALAKAEAKRLRKQTIKDGK